MRPRLLDLFCGAGGAAMGYHRAGFEVVGVDINPQPNYPFRFIRHDALALVRDALEGCWHTPGPGSIHLGHFDAVHASPPCPAYSTITPDKSKHPRLIPVVRELLQGWGVPYVIENVEGARADMDHPVKLCGSSFGLRVRRHRYFETTVQMLQPPCQHGHQGRPIGVYGDHAQDDEHYRRPNGMLRGNKAKTLDEARAAMGIDWMTWPELADAIPPAFTEYIGGHLYVEARPVTALDLPLFGDPDPVQRPGKTALGYLSWLNDVDVDGWRFWALAGSCERKATPSIEYVFLVRGGLVREALIDLDELRVIRWVTR